MILSFATYVIKNKSWLDEWKKVYLLIGNAKFQL